MRIRKLLIATVLVTLPFGLTACGGATEEDFCEAFDAIDELEEGDTDGLQDAVDELADNVPDDAGDDVQDAADTIADTFPDIAAQTDADSLEEATESSGLDEGEAEELIEALTTVGEYGESTCGS